MIGKIHSFQSLGTLDGPGVRFIAFMHGCPLHCGYCHNIDVCRGEFQEFAPEDVVEKVLRYRDYFGKDGGITVSGGEPLLQAEFASKLFSLCKEHGIHTALDTSGCIITPEALQVLDNCDLVLLDLKMTNDNDYRVHIGCGIDAPLAFLEELEKRKIPCWIRHVVVGGLNDTEENICALRNLLKEKNCIKKIELLPFKKLCEQKYQRMGIPFPFARFHEPTQEKMKQLNELL